MTAAAAAAEPAELEYAEVAGWADLARAAPPALAGALRVGTLTLPGAACLGVGAFPSMLNHAVGLSDAGGLDAADGLYRALGIGYRVSVRPAGAEGLSDALADRGFTPDGSWVKFARGVEPAPAPATDLRVAEVDPGGAAAFGAIAAGAFGMPDEVAGWLGALIGRPGWSCFAAHDGDAPVAVGAIYAAGGAGWMALGATLPSHRGRGAQPALIAARLRRAADLGCALVVTETGAAGPDGPGPSYRNILGAGFTEAWDRPNLRSPER